MPIVHEAGAILEVAVSSVVDTVAGRTAGV